jgi:hypothetical protein
MKKNDIKDDYSVLFEKIKEYKDENNTFTASYKMTEDVTDEIKRLSEIVFEAESQLPTTFTRA